MKHFKTMRRIATLLAVILCAFPAMASLLTVSITNSVTGLPDTNYVKVIPLNDNNPVLADGSIVTKGFAKREYPDTNGVLTLWRGTGFWAITNDSIALVYRFNDMSSNATAYIQSGWNTYGPAVVNISTNSGGGATNVNYTAGGVLGGYTTNATFSTSGSNVVTAIAAQVSATSSTTGNASTASAAQTGSVLESNLSGKRSKKNESVYYVTDYGATPMTVLSDVVSTASSSNITSSSANWSSSDVGKTFVLFQDSTNGAYLISTIATVSSATSATLSDNATVTATNNARYGWNCTTNIQKAIDAAWAGGGGTVLFSNMYLINGPLTNAFGQGNTVLWIPTDAGGVGQKTIQLKGANIPVQSARGLSYSPNLNVSGLYCPTINPNSSRTNSILFFGTNMPMENLVINGMQIVHPRQNMLTGLNASQGGCFLISRSVFVPDYPVGFSFSTNFWNYADANDTNAPAAIVFPTQNNPGEEIVDQSTIMGWPVGCAFSEHATIKDNTTLFYNGIGLQAWSAAALSNFGHVRFDQINTANRIEFSAPTNYHAGGQYSINANISSWQIDGVSPNVWSDPNHCLNGNLSYYGNTIPLTNSTLIIQNLSDSSRGPSIPAFNSLSGQVAMYPTNGQVWVVAANGQPQLQFWGRASDGYLGLLDGFILADNKNQNFIIRSYQTNGVSLQNNFSQTIASFRTNGDVSIIGKYVGNGNGLTNLNGANIQAGTIPTNAIDSTFRSLLLAGGGGGTNSIAVTPNLLAGDNAGGAIDSGIAGTNVALLSADNTFGGSNTFSGTAWFDAIHSPNFTVDNLYVPFTNAIPYANGTSNLQALTVSSPLSYSSGTLGMIANAYDAYGAATASTNGYPWGSLYDAVGSALAVTNGYPWQTNSIITGATLLGTNSFDDPATSDGPIRVSQNIDTLNFWSPFGNNMHFVDTLGNGWEAYIWHVHADNFYGDGTYITNAPITLGGSSITSSNGASATKILGVDASGKATTITNNFQTTPDFQSFTNGLTIGAFTNAPVSTAGTTNLIAGWMLIYTNPATSAQRWVPYITNHP